MALETNGTVRDARGLASITYTRPLVHSELEVHEADDPELACHELGLAPDLGDDVGGQRVRRQHARGVAGVDAGLLDVLHDAADPDVGAVAERVDVDLDRLLEEAVQVDLACAEPAGAAEVVGEALLRVDDLHRAATEHVRRAREQREPDGLRDDERILAGGRRGVRRRDEPKAIEELTERPRSSARSMASTLVPRIGTPASCRPAASLSGVCPPNWTMTPSGCSISTIASTSSSVSGSKYRRVEVS